MEFEQYKYDNYYELLNVSSSSTIDEIKQQYRKLARKYHPDTSGGNTEMFQKISEAFETLTDPHKRKNYDIAHNAYHLDDHNNENIDYFKASFKTFTNDHALNLTKDEISKIQNTEFNKEKDTAISRDEHIKMAKERELTLKEHDEETKNHNIAVNEFLKKNNISFNEHFEYIKSKGQQNKALTTTCSSAYDVLGSNNNFYSSYDNWGQQLNSFISDPNSISNNPHTFNYDLDELIKTNVDDIKSYGKDYNDSVLSKEDIKKKLDDYSIFTKELEQEIEQKFKDQTKLEEIKNYLNITYEINELDLNIKK